MSIRCKQGEYDSPSFQCFSNSDLYSVYKDERGAVEGIICGCVRGLDGIIPDCKLAMHANCFNEIGKEWFIIFAAGKMVLVTDWADSKVNDITTLDIWVFRQMVHGGSWKSITMEIVLTTILMDVSFVWSPFLLASFHQWRRVMIAWCVQFVMISFLLTFLWFLLTP